MVDSMMYQEDGYVVLESNQPEQLLTELELLNKLENILKNPTMNIPQDVAKFDSKTKQAQYLLENYCEWEIDENNYLQWYVVRWEKS